MTDSTMADREDRETLLRATGDCFDGILALGRDLSDDEWAAQSLCPDWTVRQMIAHAAGVEEALLGWSPSLEQLPPLEKVGALIEASTSMSATDFVDRVVETFTARRAELARLTDADLDMPSITPVGPNSYGGFLGIRIFDLWVHERDARIPLDRPADDGGVAAEITVDQIERSIGYIVGKRVGLPDGMSIRFDLHGPVERRIAAVVEGRAAAVDSLDDPDVIVSADSTAFVMLACGRVDPQEMIDAGRISWTGDAEWGDAAARNLRFTI